MAHDVISHNPRKLPGVVLIVVLSVLLFTTLTSYAQEESEPQPSGEATSEDSAEIESTAEEEPADSEDKEDPCESPYDHGQSVLDWLNKRTHRKVCESAMWFDSFFGDDRAIEEYSHTGGRMSAHGLWTEHDGFDFRFSFRVQISLPNLDDRWHAIIGRESTDEFLSDTGYRSNPGGAPTGFDEEQQFLVGLGWTPLRDDYDRLSFRVGVTVTWPPDPYAKVIFRHSHYFSDATMLRWRQTGFWKLEDGFGTTTNLDVETRLSDVMLFRWVNTATISEVSDGVEWWTTPTLYRNLTVRSAVALSTWAHGSTRAEVGLEEVGIRLVYRQRVAHDWLYVDVGPMLSWPKFEVDEARTSSWGALVGLEMHFGERARP